jgi:hypothetical protein
MSVKTELTCPLGSKCEEVRDNALHRCAWFIELAGRNPNTGQEVNERGCAMAWVPILLIENSQQQKSTAAAVESFRNEVVAVNKQTLPLLAPLLQNDLR